MNVTDGRKDQRNDGRTDGQMQRMNGRTDGLTDGHTVIRPHCAITIHRSTPFERCRNDKELFIEGQQALIAESSLTQMLFVKVFKAEINRLIDLLNAVADVSLK